MKNRKFIISILLALLCVCFAPSAASAETTEAAETPEIAEMAQLLNQPLTIFNLNDYLLLKNTSAFSDVHIHTPKFISYDPAYINDNGDPKDGFLTAICSDTGCGAVFSVCVPYGISYQEVSHIDSTETSNGLVTWRFDPTQSRTLTEEEQVHLLSTFDVVTEIMVTGHVWDEGVITTAPTCAAMGIKTYTCLTCGATRVECMKRTNHYDNWVFKNWVEKPTCVNPIGRASYTCTQCNDEVLFVRSGTDAEMSAAHVWDEGEVTIAATEEEDGEKTFTCTLCGETKTEITHNWVASERVDATCTEDGYIQYICANCTELGEKEILTATGHSWETLEDGTKYCSTCNTDEEGKPLFTAADYEVSRTEQDYSSEEALGDFADIVGDDEQLMYFADVTMISVEDGEEVSEFSAHGNCPSFDISLADLGIDSSTPIGDIHVYHQHENDSPYEIPECDKMIIDGKLRIFSRDFSDFVITVNKIPVSIQVEWNGTTTSDLTLTCKKQDGSAEQPIPLNSGNQWAYKLTDIIQGDKVTITGVPDGFTVSTDEQSGEIVITRNVLEISYSKTWKDENEYYKKYFDISHPTDSYIRIDYSTDGGENWKEGPEANSTDDPVFPSKDKIDSDTNSWTNLPTYLNIGTTDSPNYVKVCYRITEKTTNENDLACYDVTYSLNGKEAKSTQSEAISADTSGEKFSVAVLNTFKPKDWKVQIRWQNASRIVLTIPNSVEMTVLYSTDNGKTYQQLPKNSDFTMKPEKTTSSGYWEDSILGLPAGYRYEVIEKRIIIGGTSYIAQYSDTAKLKGYCYRYEYASRNFQTQSINTLIINRYNPSAVPVTSDQSQMNLWLTLIAGSISLTGGALFVFFRNPARYRKGKMTHH